MNRWIIAISSVLICQAIAVASPAVAGEDDKTADEIFADAEQAVEDEEFRRALDLLELAERKEPKPRYTYRRILVLEEIGEYAEALALLDSERRELAGESGVGDLTALEERLKEARDTERSEVEPPPAASGSNTDVLGWSLAASGVATAAGGTVALLAAKSNLDQVYCAGNYPSTTHTQCQGVDAATEMSEREFDQRTTRTERFRMLGGGLLGIGVMAAGYGTYRLLAPKSATGAPHRAKGATRPVMTTTLGWSNGFRLQWKWRF